MLLGFLVRDEEIEKRRDAKRSSLQGTAPGATALKVLMAQLQRGGRPPSTAVEIVQIRMPAGDMLNGLMNPIDRWHDQYKILSCYCGNEGLKGLRCVKNSSGY